MIIEDKDDSLIALTSFVSAAYKIFNSFLSPPFQIGNVMNNNFFSLAL